MSERVADPPAWLTPLEVAALLRVHPRTVRNWLRTQQLAGVKIGASWRIDATALETYLHPNSIVTTSSRTKA